MVECLTYAHILSSLAVVSAQDSAPRKWIEAHGVGDFAIACSGFVLLLGIGVVLLLLWLRIGRLVDAIAERTTAQEKTVPTISNAASQAADVPSQGETTSTTCA